MPSAFYGVNLPVAWNSLECLAAAICKAQTGASHQVFDSSRHQHFASPGKRSHSGTNVNRNATDIVAHHFALAGVQPCANINSEWVYFLGNSAGAADAARRTIECCKYPVAGRLDFSTAKPSEIAADRQMMIVQQIVPVAVAKRGSFLSRTNDVGKENGSKHPVDFYRRS